MREVMTVVKTDDRYVYLQAITEEASCSACALSGNCSIKSGDMRISVKKENVEKAVEVGDTVIVDLKYNQAVLAMILYGIPLSGFLLGVLVGYFFKLSDIISLVLGLALAGGGFLISKLFDKKYEVKIVDVKDRGNNYPKNLTNNGIV